MRFGLLSCIFGALLVMGLSMVLAAIFWVIIIALGIKIAGWL